MTKLIDELRAEGHKSVRDFIVSDLILVIANNYSKDSDFRTSAGQLVDKLDPTELMALESMDVREAMNIIATGMIPKLVKQYGDERSASNPGMNM